MADTAGRQLTELEVTEWSKEQSGPNLTRTVAATNSFVNSQPVEQQLDPDDAWPEHVRIGALMLAARLIKRRNSPNGIEAATDMNVTYTARYDSDIARMLQLDKYQAPAVG